MAVGVRNKLAFSTNRIFKNNVGYSKYANAIPATKPSLMLNFLENPTTRNHGVTIASTRSTVTATYFDQSLVLKTAPANEVRFNHDLATGACLGLMSELAATNLCLRSRDLTNAVWNTVTNITPALTQIGIDGVASSASLLTSTDVDGVITQAITSASAARVFTAYVKRTIGIGTISMTLDGGSTYTDVTSSLIKGRWVRVKATQTVTNPAIGFKISTSGDAIIVDYCQIENNTHETSPVLSVAAAGVRQPDNISIASITNWYNQSVGTIYVDAIATNGLAAANQYVIQFDDATSNERHIIFRGTTRLPTGFTADGGVTQVTLNTGTWSDNTAAKLIYAYTLNDCAASFNGAAIQTDVVATMPTVTTLRIGVSQASSSHWGGHIRRILYWPFRINNSMMLKLAA